MDEVSRVFSSVVFHAKVVLVSLGYCHSGKETFHRSNVTWMEYDEFVLHFYVRVEVTARLSTPRYSTVDPYAMIHNNAAMLRLACRRADGIILNSLSWLLQCFVIVMTQLALLKVFHMVQGLVKQQTDRTTLTKEGRSTR